MDDHVMTGRRPRLLVWLVSSLFVALGQVPAPAEPPAAPAVAGRWLAPFSEGGAFDEAPPDTPEESARYPTAVSLAVLPDGRILYWNGLEGTENLQGPIAANLPNPNESRTRVLDLSAYLRSGADPRKGAAWSIPRPEHGGGGDLFCADQRHLADGRVIVVGGTEWVSEEPGGLTELFGRDNVRVFDPETGRWTQKASMHHRRWYPVLLTLPDGRLLAATGVRKLIRNTDGMNVRRTEIYDPRRNTWTDNGPDGAAALPLFARLHLLPNGRVFYDATGQMWGPAGWDAEQAVWNLQRWYDPESNQWESVGPAPLGARNGAFSAMLPLRPPYDRARLLIGGGTAAPAGAPGTWVGNAMSEIVTWQADGIGGPGQVTREIADDLNNMRWYSSAVVLPSGEVIALSGADRDEVVDPGSEMPVRQAEMFDPVTGTWTELASGARDRTYHNSAVLLRDGSILVGGHSPLVAHYGDQHQTTPGFANNFKDPSFEIFQPPYLFRGDRPEIEEASRRIGRRGGEYPIETPDAGDPTLQVVLSRLPATTHITDADQRTVELPIIRRANGTVTVRVPGDAAVLPPGLYYLFLLKDNGEGPTPSRAKIVSVPSA